MGSSKLARFDHHMISFGKPIGTELIFDFDIQFKKKKMKSKLLLILMLFAIGGWSANAQWLFT